MKNNITKIIILLLISVTFSGCIGVNQDFKNIRSQIINGLDDKFDRQIEFSVGPVSFFLVSQFVKFSDNDENLDAIVSNISKMQIGIYDRLSNFSEPSLKLLKAISNSIMEDDWKSIVKSIDKDEMVGIFIKSEFDEQIEEIFLVNLSDDELVILELHGDLGEVIELLIQNNGHNIEIVNNS